MKKKKVGGGLLQVMFYSWNIRRNEINSLQYNPDIKLILMCTKFKYNVQRTEIFAHALYQINKVFQFLHVVDFRTGFIKHNRFFCDKFDLNKMITNINSRSSNSHGFCFHTCICSVMCRFWNFSFKKPCDNDFPAFPNIYSFEIIYPSFGPIYGHKFWSDL